MAFQDRIKSAAYTSPAGVRTEFLFDSVERGFELRGTQHNFIDTQGTFIQGTGSTGRVFPFTLILSGDNYDTAADRFFESLREPGTGRLEHPLYGTINVVPLGQVTQLDNLVVASGQAVFQVTFWETLSSLFPSGALGPLSQLLAAVSEYVATIADTFPLLIDLDTQIEIVSVINQATAIVGNVKQSVETIVSATEQVFDRFNDIADGLVGSLVSGVLDVDSFIGQMVNLIHTPARSTSPWSEKLTAFSTVINANLITVEPDFTFDSRQSNKFVTADLTVTSALTGLVASIATTTFTTRPEAIVAAQNILALSEVVNTWREDNFAALEMTDTGEVYQQVQDAVALAAGHLVQLSFDLAHERTIILDRPRSIIDLAAELYGDPDGRLDFLMSSNSMTGNEIVDGLLVGRSVKYYV